MSLIREGRLSVRPFSAVPALNGLPAIHRAPRSVSISSFRGSDGGINLSEGCFITKVMKYTHQLAHWINAVRNDDPSEVEALIANLSIIPYQGFHLDHPCNLTFLEAFIHTSLDLYAFIAVTASLNTLTNLIAMVRSDNDRRQVEIDNEGVESGRHLDFSNDGFVDPEYELVVLHPEHFLPHNIPLAVYEPSTGNYRNYFAARDLRLRQSMDPHSPPFPAFRHASNLRAGPSRLNVFLVVLNAEIKFRRYLAMVRQFSPMVPLPQGISDLMDRTTELVNLIYWKPVPASGTRGEAWLATVTARRNPTRAARHRPLMNFERNSAEELETDSQEMQVPPTGSISRRLQWFANADLEKRMAYGRALMSAPNRDYDPALFEDESPIKYDCTLYSEKANVKTWLHATSEHSSA